MPAGKVDRDVDFACSIIVEDGPTAEESLIAQAGATDDLIDSMLELMRTTLGSARQMQTESGRLD